jgi:hypothetical protein
MTPPQPVLDWLLDENTPSVRYRTLTELLDEPHDTPDARAAREQIAETRWARRIFGKMHPEGYWLYRDKGAGVDYAMSSSTHFVLAFLAELGLDRDEPRVARAVERYLNLAPPDYHTHQSCLYAYNLRTFVMLGYRDDPRVQTRAQVLRDDVRHDGGYLCERASFNERTKSCVRGTIKALTAFAALPKLWDTDACHQLVDYFLRRRVFFRTDRPDEVIRDELVSTIYPFVISGSLLEPLHALSAIGYGQHPALDPAWTRLEAKFDDRGRVLLDWYPPSYFTPGPKGKVNKWTTLYAYLALKHRGKRSKLVYTKGKTHS